MKNRSLSGFWIGFRSVHYKLVLRRSLIRPADFPKNLRNIGFRLGSAALIVKADIPN